MMIISKQCLICNIAGSHMIRFNSMEGYMQFRAKKKIERDLKGGFICLDCREILRKELEEESGIKID